MRTNADKAALIIAVLSLLLGFSLAQNQLLYQRVQELEHKEKYSLDWNIKIGPATKHLYLKRTPTEIWITSSPKREPLLNQDEVLHRKMKHLYCRETTYR